MDAEVAAAIAAALDRGAQTAIENRALAEAAEAVGDTEEAKELRDQADELERRLSRYRSRADRRSA
jgi:hypothetical protein